jgi:hypothetical protein
MECRKMRFVHLLVGAVSAGLTAQAVRAASVGNVNDAFLADVGTTGPHTETYGDFAYGYSDTTTDPGFLSGFSTAAYGFTPPSGFVNSPGVDGFYVDNNISVPAIVGNTTGSVTTTTYGATLQAGQLLLHPGGVSAPDGYTPPYSAADIRYTVPLTGRYDVTADFSQIHTGNTDDSIYVNGIEVAGPGVSSPTGPTLSYLSPGLLAKGTTIDIVAAAHAGNIGSASTGLFANIAAVPLPRAVYGGATVAALALISSRFRRRARWIA